MHPLRVHRTALAKWTEVNLTPHEPQSGLEAEPELEIYPIRVLVVGMEGEAGLQREASLL